MRLAPDGAQLCGEVKALERVPVIEILTHPDEIAAKAMTGRAGRFYRDSRTLFVNGRYSAVGRMASDLEAFCAGQGDVEEMRRIVLLAAQRFTAFRVGKAICYAISKRLAEDWTTDDLDRATSPESLCLAADDFGKA